MRPALLVESPRIRPLAPRWCAPRAARWSRLLLGALVDNFGRHGLLWRLAHPRWLRCFGAWLGLDPWSPGFAAELVAALREGAADGRAGLAICGGAGKGAAHLAQALEAAAARGGFDAGPLIEAADHAAVVDEVALDDGHAVHLRAFFVAGDGEWAAFQQGVHPVDGTRRGYHWIGFDLHDPFDAPHAAIEGPDLGHVRDLTHRDAGPARARMLSLIADGPDRALACLRTARRALANAAVDGTLALGIGARPEDAGPPCDEDEARFCHEVAAAPAGFGALLRAPEVSVDTLRDLAACAEGAFGCATRFPDQAGDLARDVSAFRVSADDYHEAVEALRRRIDRSRLDADERDIARAAIDAGATALGLAPVAAEVPPTPPPARRRRRRAPVVVQPDLPGL